MHTNWCDQARTKLAAMDALVAQGRGNTLVSGGGCTEPGGGIVPTTHTVREMAAMLRQQVARCGAGTLAQTPQCWYPQGETPNAPGSTCYLLNETKQLSKGGIYSFFIAIPSTMQDCCGTGSAADLLTQQGWNIAGFGSPPAGYAQALQVLVSQNLPAPAVWQVNATWNGPDGAVLPGHIGSTADSAIYFGPIFTGYPYVGPPAPEAPVVEPPVNQPTWPMVVGLAAGVAIIGGAWWYVRKESVHKLAPSYAENPIEHRRRPDLRALRAERRPSDHTIRIAIGTLSHNRMFTVPELAQYLRISNGEAMKITDRLGQAGYLVGHAWSHRGPRMRPTFYFPSPQGWAWIEQA